MEKTPLVSICMPAYNVDSFIEETIQSVIAQTFENWELIIVDDGSTDATAAILSKTIDYRIKVLSSANQGAAAARNLAYQKAEGKYIVFFDADDLIPTNFLANQLSMMNNEEGVVVLSAWGRFYNNDLSSFQPTPMIERVQDFGDWIKTYWHQANPMTNPGRVLFSRYLAEIAGPWNEELTLNDDLEYFTRVFLASKKIMLNPDATLYYRSGVQGLSGKKGQAAYDSFYKSLYLSVSNVLKVFNKDRAILKSCANMWQNFSYEIYPVFGDINNKVQLQINQLGGSDLPFPAGGYTKIISTLIGWKATKRLKHFFKVG